MELYRVIYVSRCTLPDEPEAAATGIRQILLFSRAWNARTGTTGALMCSQTHFAQVLEGPPPVIKATYGHISCDPRNRDPKLLENGPVEFRAFPNWSMAFIDAAGQPEISLAAINQKLAAPTAQAILAMLRWLVQTDSAPVGS